MEQYFLIGVALVFVFEGILPFLSPRMWRRLMTRIVTQNDPVLRVMGLGSMLLGLGILYWVH